MSQGKYWCFTLNNPQIDSIPLAWECAYVVYQKEKAASGTLHLQGYVEFISRKKLETLKKLSQEAHWEVRRGSQAEAIAYCQKEDTRVAGPWEKGVKSIPEQGKRSDLLTLKESIESGVPMTQVVSDNFVTMSHFYKFANYYRGLLKSNQRMTQTKALVYWGPPDVGKTTYVKQLAGSNAFWLRQPQSHGQLWWDGYDGNEAVVIDEFYGWISRTFMQRLIDHTPLMVDTKGGAVNFCAKIIYIISNNPPEEWWPKVGLGSAMHRRLQEPIGSVIYVKHPMWLPSPPESAVVPQAVDTVYAPHRKAAQDLIKKYLSKPEVEAIDDRQYLLTTQELLPPEPLLKKVRKDSDSPESHLCGCPVGNDHTCEEEKTPTCWRCGKEGHWGRQCPDNNNNKKKEAEIKDLI